MNKLQSANINPADALQSLEASRTEQVRGQASAKKTQGEQPLPGRRKLPQRASWPFSRESWNEVQEALMMALAFGNGGGYL